MKNRIFAAVISLLITVTPQLALSAEGSNAEDKRPAEGSDDTEKSGTAAGAEAAGSALGGISLIFERMYPGIAQQAIF